MIYDNIRWNIHKCTGYYRSTDRKDIRLHRYIYEKHDGEIPKGMVIHHIDENKLNNDISNLVMMTQSEHSKLHHAGNEYWSGKKHLEETKKKRSIAVIQLSKEGSFIAEFCGLREAKRLTGINNSDISSVCKGKANQAGGFKWMYKSDYIKLIELKKVVA